MHAHQADPDVLLFYNDFNLESNPTKRNSVISYLNTLRFRGVKIDGIGLQMHVSLYSPETAQIAASFKEVANNHYKLHVSELDISLNPAKNMSFPDESLFAEQADYLGKIILHYKQIPSPYQYGITVWGVSDRDSWIPSYFNREDYPLLYDNNYKPKPAYCRLIEIL
ncbi:MAG: endo-1,4-beta-xylanase [Saprospiraceae bacterium]|nr:endo-1,4-beta-xylanase [Saprospiraceae bacterium]